MPPRPVIFIGSSSEGVEVARAVEFRLRDVCEPIVWDQGVFAPGSSTLEALVSQLSKFDFAILIFSGDDLVESRGSTALAPRDNVLLELGLFIGNLGRHRTFVIYSSEVKIPSDLAGVTLVKYDTPQQGTILNAISPPCFMIEMAIRQQGKLQRPSHHSTLKPTPPKDPETKKQHVKQQLEKYGNEILGSTTESPSLDLWYTRLYPVLRQTMYYTMPTYFLDTDLNIIDWNIAFQLVFSEVVGGLRYNHVNVFIANLENSDEVFNHGRDFTKRVHAGVLPLVDLEPLVYRSNRYGDVKLLKVATQMHDTSGNLCGWAVGLMVKEIDWPLLEIDLNRHYREDKMWSVYAPSYDRVLKEFPPYAKLIQDVINVIPSEAHSVIDIGAGTGNVTEVLLQRGYHVSSLEFNQIMIDKMRAKGFDSTKHEVFKASAENLYKYKALKDGVFDAAIMVNVLYSIEDKQACLKGIHRILKPRGVLGLSTTHADITLDPLLLSIKQTLKDKKGKYEELAEDYKRVEEINKEIERTIALQVPAQKYKELVQEAGFEIIREEDFTYENAVMLIHARKL